MHGPHEKFRSRNPIARAAHELAALDRLTAQHHVLDGKPITTMVGFNAAGLPVFTTRWFGTAEPWWDFEPDEYEGA